MKCLKLCFNLGIEVLLISRRFRSRAHLRNHACFNLVIEVLLISRVRGYGNRARAVHQGFNLVIEVLLISSCIRDFAMICDFEFQSRNRGSFDFKNSDSDAPTANSGHCFNLVIEVLLISRHGISQRAAALFEFQSRNRGSFDFKSVDEDDAGAYHIVSIS